jgi:hypothetical protein
MFSVFRHINTLKAVHLLYFQIKNTLKRQTQLCLKKQKTTPKHRFLFQLTN